jgi:hypothetical protein
LMGFEKKSRHAKISEDSVAFDNVISWTNRDGEVKTQENREKKNADIGGQTGLCEFWNQCALIELVKWERETQTVTVCFCFFKKPFICISSLLFLFYMCIERLGNLSKIIQLVCKWNNQILFCI